MDEIAILQRSAPATPPMSELARLRARRQLLKRALEPSPAQRRRRRFKRIAVAGVVAAGALGIAGALPFGGGHVGADPAAAAVLELSANNNLGQPAPGPGQYLYTRRVATSWSYGPESKEAGSPSTAQVGHQVNETWVPVDRSKPWVSKITATVVEGGKPFVQTESSRDYGPKLYRDYPKDPDDLLAKVRGMGHKDDELTGDLAVWERAGEMLSDPVASTAFKADLLRALTRMEGVEIVDAHAIIGNHTGVAIAYSKDRLGGQLVFDSKTGDFLGLRGVAKHQETWTGPDNTTSAGVLTKTEIVDAAPAPKR